MRKEEIYSFILNLMKRIEYSRENQFNKINKILFLTIYYNIFESKYDEVIKEDSDDKQVQNFIDNFLIEEDKDIEELIEENEFKKIEENSIFKYKEEKESIESIKKDKQDDEPEVKKGEENSIEEDKFKKVDENSMLKYKDAKSEVDNITNYNNNLENKINKEEIKEDNLLINNGENKFYKIEEKNINHNIIERKEIEEIAEEYEVLKKKYKLEVDEYQQITNNLKTIIETECNTKNRVSKDGTTLYDNDKGQVNHTKIRTFVKIADSSINEVLYGKVKFSKPVIKIIDIRGYVTFKNISLVKNSYKPNCEDSIIMYNGTVRVDLQYLEDTKVHCSNIDAVPKYYLMYIPFSGTKSVIIDDEDFINEKDINDKISLDIRYTEFAYDTSLKEERCIGPYIKLYRECEVFIIMECGLNILMKKVIETL